MSNTCQAADFLLPPSLKRAALVHCRSTQDTIDATVIGFISDVLKLQASIRFDWWPVLFPRPGCMHMSHEAGIYPTDTFFKHEDILEVHHSANV